MPENTAYVGRGSKYGNPFNATQRGVVFYCRGLHGGYPIVNLRTDPSLDRCIDMYVAYLKALTNQDPAYLRPLRGKNLACWCPLDQPCHADVLLRLANA